MKQTIKIGLFGIWYLMWGGLFVSLIINYF